MRTEDGVAIGAEFDFRQKGEQSWDIELTTDQRHAQAVARRREARDRRQGRDRATPAWPANTRASISASRALCEARQSEVDWRPFQLVADAFLIGERRIVAATRDLETP